MGGKRRVGKSASIFRIRMPRGLQVGSRVKISDNSGAKLAFIIAVIGGEGRGRLNRLSSATLGTLCVVSIKKGVPDLRKKVMRAVIVRQKKTFRRIDGTHIQFEDNAAVIVTDEGDPKASQINGPIAREAAELFPRISNVASQII